uniref:Polysaccharide deacetylase n=1 Tax=Nitratidesulfovibrio vulgaris (strain DSM 19637 / Miyazaki F) TaxID=883 RepID=B8DKU8_NITV9
MSASRPAAPSGHPGHSGLKSLPVLMYHYVSRKKNSIAVHPDTFEAHCRAMRRAGWTGISLAEAEAYLLGETPLPPRSALITFDDGFLDNYVYAWPILKKYGHKGVIFAVAGKLEQGAPRPTLDDVRAGRIREDGLPRVDAPFVPHVLGFDERKDLFCNWDEARLMEADGTMAVAAHSHWHHAVFAKPEYTGFHAPAHRSRTFDRVDFAVPWGLPAFAQRPALLHRAFVPDPQLVEAIRAMVPQDKAAAYAFFQDSGKVRELEDMVAAFAATPSCLGKPESDADRTARMTRELAACASTLADELGHPVRSLCWPWGAYCDEARDIARAQGFSVFFATTMGPNPPGCAAHVHRFKAKDKPASWLMLRLMLYSLPWLARLYAKVRL